MSILIYKSRVQSPLLALYHALHTRMALSRSDQQTYLNLKKGFEGELLFDAILQKLQCDYLLLADLLLKVNNQTFQIDTLLIVNHQIYLFEVKNYIGDYFFENDRFFHKNRSEITNPITQLQRTESLFRQLLLKYKNPIPVQASVVFINPEFALYQAPMNKPFILPNQLNRFVSKLNKVSLKITDQQKDIAKQITSLHMHEPTYNQRPNYTYEHLQKGIRCINCDSFELTIFQGRVCICNKCKNEESLQLAVVRAVKEFSMFFPDEKITTDKMVNWCNIEVSNKTIKRILDKNFKKSGSNRWIYYN